jgi:hypothetical protein
MLTAMQCTVYLLREYGKRLPLEVVRAGPGVRGWLRVGPRSAIREAQAHLVDQDGKDLLPVLEQVLIKRLDGRGLLLQGLNTMPYPLIQTVRQGWWCVLPTPAA